ncbi:MAG: hypothetical protein L0212_04120 [Acidobacteria bacterium]|nr:hypothetical protein [Acidobacteriota bacterium]
MAKKNETGVAVGDRVCFIADALKGEIGVVKKINPDGNCVVAIIEGAHAGGSGVYQPHTEFAVANVESEPTGEAEGDDEDDDGTHGSDN